MAEPVTLEQALVDIDQQLDEVLLRMQAEGVSNTSLAFADQLLRPGYKMIVTAHGLQVPVPDIDEAMVSTFASLFLEYIKRVHPRSKRKEAVEHARLIFDDTKERLLEGIADSFRNGTKNTPVRH